ncbi:hypothetical protein PIB30_104928 [Stylosanthes scabra]|uniref:Uncharacterized protein n=2 Tax=Stylosanthes scabra TaxID=79078 RepID=A0ABU6XY16_9FABA|nr:hypothetical protein [Stylosanthes scabra]
MPRSKKTAPKRQRQSDDVVYMEPPSDHPLFQYFSRLDDLNNYIFNFSERKEISPRYLDIKILETQNFNALHSILTSQGFIDFVQIRESYYPVLVAIAYSTLSIEFNEECATEFTLRFRLLKNEYEVDSGTLSTIWGFDDLDTSNCVLFDGNKTPESWGPHVKRQAFEMFNIQRVHKKKILCNVNIQREEEEQAPPRQAQEPQEDQAGPSEQPSMRDMMQVLLRIEQNQANMDTHLTRVDQRLSRIEQYLEIDEDEDQD